MSDDSQAQDNSAAAEKVRSFPQTPGVYLMKDAAGRVIYVGKAKNLRSRAGSYFLKAAADEMRTARLVREIADIDYIEAESEIDALLMEARLIKDIQPKFNKELKDGKTFPYLEIHTGRGLSAGRLHAPAAGPGHPALRPVHQRRAGCAGRSRCCRRSSSSAPARWTSRTATRGGSGSALACWPSIHQCTAPCNLRISKEEYRKDIRRLMKFLDGNKKELLDEMRREMSAAAAGLPSRPPRRLRDEMHLLETLDERGDLETHVQPEVFPIDPKKGLAGLRKVLRLAEPPRTIEGIDIAHLGGSETVASVVQFIDGLPFKPGYKRMQIRTVQGVDDFASIHEVVSRRFHRLRAEGELFPDILLVDGGKGQLHAAMAALGRTGHRAAAGRCRWPSARRRSTCPAPRSRCA